MMCSLIEHYTTVEQLARYWVGANVCADNPRNSRATRRDAVKIMKAVQNKAALAFYDELWEAVQGIRNGGVHAPL